MSIAFNGSEITVLSAKRPSFGYYSSQLDNGPIMYSLGYSEVEQMQVPIYTAKGLDPAFTHHLTLTNLPSHTSPSDVNSPDNSTRDYFFEIDAIIIGLPVTDTIYTSVYDDQSNAITYNGSWDNHPDFDPRYYERSAHVVNAKNSGFTFKWNGSSIEWRAGVNTDHGAHSVVIDGGPPVIVNSSYYQLLPDTTIFLATNLSEEFEHTLTVVNLGSPTGDNNVIDLDRLIVNTTRSPDAPINGTNTNTTTSESEPQMSNSISAPNKSTIIGAVVGGVLGLIVITLALWFFFIRPKRRRAPVTSEPKTVDLAPEATSYRHSRFDGREVAPFPSSQNGTPATSPAESRPVRQMSQSTGSGVTHDPTQQSGYFTAFPPPPPSNATSYPRSAGVMSPTGPPPVPWSEAPQSSTLVSSSRPSVLKVETTAPSTQRDSMVDGEREEDGGPMRRASQEGREGYDMLPPAYEQAVQNRRREEAGGGRRSES